MKVGVKYSQTVVLLFSENEVDKSEISDDADSIWTDEDEDLSNSDSTDGKNMLPLSITVQPDMRTYHTTTSAGLFPRVYLFGETLKLIYDNNKRDIGKFFVIFRDGPDFQYTNTIIISQM